MAFLSQSFPLFEYPMYFDSMTELNTFVAKWLPNNKVLVDPNAICISAVVGTIERKEMSIQDTLNERQTSHGDFFENSRVAQELKIVCRTGQNWKKLSVTQKEIIEMHCTKLGRILAGDPNFEDHWKDIAGYATLEQNIQTTGQPYVSKEVAKDAMVKKP